MKEAHVKIGEMIRTSRVRKGMTQMDLSRKLGYETPQFVSFMERGMSKVPYAILRDLSTILGLKTTVIKKLLVREFEQEFDAAVKVTKG